MEKISSTVSALLGLVGLTDLDPVVARAHPALEHLRDRLEPGKGPGSVRADPADPEPAFR